MRTCPRCARALFVDERCERCEPGLAERDGAGREGRPRFPEPSRFLVVVGAGILLLATFAAGTSFGATGAVIAFGVAAAALVGLASMFF